jgi:hypothetical protein
MICHLDHIDNHLDETPLQYLLQRYQTGEDLEELQSANRKLTPEEEKKMKEGAIVVVEGQKRIIEDITNRKKLKQSFEYECNFKGLSSSENIWLSRDELIKRGFEKKILEVDSREAQKAGLLRPLVRKEIENHMSMFGLEPEFVTHNVSSLPPSFDLMCLLSCFCSLSCRLCVVSPAAKKSKLFWLLRHGDALTSLSWTSRLTTWIVNRLPL